MYLERLLQINMATMAALGALLLGMGQRSVESPLMVAMGAAAAVWLTDITGKLQIRQVTANLLMVVCAVFSFHNLSLLGNELQVFTFARFLIFIQIILLFQKKDEWKYWLLVMLSLLEVMVAALFSQGIFFGVLLALYMLLGFSCMTLLMLHRQWKRFQGAEGVESFAGQGGRRRLSEMRFPSWNDFFRQLSPSPSVLNPKELALRGQGDGPIFADAKIGTVPSKTSRWPLAGQQAAFTGQPAGSSHAGIGADLYRRLGWMSASTLAMTLVLFFAVPRFGQFPWRGAIAQSQSLVGYTDEVKLGELGQIIENRAGVMQVRFFDKADDETPLKLSGDIYLQGAFMMRYRHGQWSGGAVSGDPGVEPLGHKRELPWVGVVRQTIKIDALDHDELFFVSPYIAVESNLDISADWPRQRLHRAGYRLSRQFEYTLGTTAIVGNEQGPLIPAGANDFVSLDYPKKDLPNLAALAQRWMDESGLPKEKRLERARYLEKKLSSSGQFEYSLVGQDRDPTIDPIEDFVAKHPRGHCEYFATALTLMLRSQGIPARMVSGFKCDGSDWNEMGGCYQVRQLHAHTWVEAYLKEDQVPRELMHGKGYWTEPEGFQSQTENGRAWKCGGWIRLDPTPAGETDKNAGWFSSVRNGMDMLDFAWSRYVVELDFQRQRDAIYQPIANAAKKVWRELTSPSRWKAMADSLALALYLDHLGREVKWIVLGLIGLLFAAVLAFLGWQAWRLVRRLRSRWTGNQKSRRLRSRRVEIEFYRRLETLLARHGLVREPAQTQLEFAAAAGACLAAIGGKSDFASLPTLVADAFYRVRFGRQPLDNLQAQKVEQALAELSEIGRKHM
jgi:protein-glutamine gamma-glutamyltransferase